MAGHGPLRLWPEIKNEHGLWSLLPHVEAEPGSTLHYDIVARKSGRSGTTSTRQRGQIAIGADGQGKLAQLRIGVGAEDRCEVEIKVYDEKELIGELNLHLPD